MARQTACIMIVRSTKYTISVCKSQSYELSVANHFGHPCVMLQSPGEFILRLQMLIKSGFFPAKANSEVVRCRIINSV